MLSPQGYVSECTGENIFIVKKGRIITPPVSAGALEGITQDSVFTIARDLGYEVQVGNILRSDLYTCRRGVRHRHRGRGRADPSRSTTASIGDRGPITTAIQAAYFAAVRGETDRYKDWNEHVR